MRCECLVIRRNPIIISPVSEKSHTNIRAEGSRMECKSPEETFMQLNVLPVTNVPA
jgi:hypothetical protein